MDAGFWMFIIGFIVFVVWLAATQETPKPDTSYNPENVMGDNEFASDEEIRKGGKLRLR